MVPPHSHIEVFLPNHEGSKSSAWTCCTSVRNWVRRSGFRNKFKYLSLLKYDSNLSNAAFEGRELGSLALLEHHPVNSVCGVFFLPCQCVSASSEDLACLVLLGCSCVSGFKQPTGTWGSREVRRLEGQRNRWQITGEAAKAWRKIPSEWTDSVGFSSEVW